MTSETKLIRAIINNSELHEQIDATDDVSGKCALIIEQGKKLNLAVTENQALVLLSGLNGALSDENLEAIAGGGPRDPRLGPMYYDENWAQGQIDGSMFPDDISFESGRDVHVEGHGMGDNINIGPALFGSASVDGGEGDDTINVSTMYDAQNIPGAARGVDVQGGSGDDDISGGHGEHTLDGGSGDDFITARDGKSLLLGGEGDDHLISYGDDTLGGGEGNDTLVAYGSHARTMHGGDGQDEISGGGGADTIYAGTGDDNVVGGAGNDSIYGGSGNDTVSGGTGHDSIDGGWGDDSIFGGSGNDTIRGDTGDDTLRGGTGADDFVFGHTYTAGGEGDDVIMDFNPHEDRLVFEGLRYEDLHVSYGEGKTYISYGQSTLTLEGLMLTKDQVWNTANNPGNSATDSPGNDILTSTAANEVLHGGSGADVFVFDTAGGNDVINDFNPHEDRLDFQGASYDDLDVSHEDGKTVITYGDTTVTLEGLMLTKDQVWQAASTPAG